MSVLNVKETGSLFIEENFVDEMLGELELVADIPSK
jgi:hypothetical protein